MAQFQYFIGTGPFLFQNYLYLSLEMLYKNSMEHNIPYYPKKFIFIHGIMRRSGTNFLHDLLCLHPAIGSGGPIREDYFLHYADLLKNYVRNTRMHWPIIPNDANEHQRLDNEFLLHLGKGLKELLIKNVSAEEIAKYKPFRTYVEDSIKVQPEILLSKTPSVTNLSLFSSLFPEADLIIIIRDGASLVESSVKTFEGRYESYMRLWIKAAKFIDQFEKLPCSHKPRYRIISYEELVKDTENVLRGIFSFIGAETSQFDFQRIKDLPVRGSSSFKQEGAPMDWTRKAKIAFFAPLSRSAHWPRSRVRYFQWLKQKHLDKNSRFLGEQLSFTLTEKLQYRYKDFLAKTLNALSIQIMKMGAHQPKQKVT